MAVATLNTVTAFAAPSTVFVGGGSFLMGSDNGRPDEAPVREVEVRPLRVGRAPVSNLEYAWFLRLSRVPAPPWWNDADFWDPGQPVVGITWQEATAYCAWLGETLGGQWRLPTEAEWEHAARGGLEQRTTPWGNHVPPGELPEPPVSRPWPIGRGLPNGHGLLDVGTVVHEWCLDWYTPDAYRTLRRYDPRGPVTGALRVRRGGSWRRRQLSVSQRDGVGPTTRTADGGFRVVREVP